MSNPTLTGTIVANKELDGAAFPSLLIGQITFADSTVLRVSTHPLNVAEGGFQYSSQNYYARIKDHQLDPTQAVSETGIDIIPTCKLELLDPDKFLWTNYEFPVGKGFCGATLNLVMILWDPDTGAYSSDSAITFTGILSAPTSISATTITVTATNLLNMSRVLLPKLRIQQRCLNNFPTTFAQRNDGSSNQFSIFNACGYSPDGTNAYYARGNYQTGTTPFTKCNYTKSDCVARGMYITDSSARVTGRYSGIQWSSSPTWRGKSYLQGKTVTGFNAENEAVYGQPIPLVYGTQMIIGAPVIPIVGAADSTRFEVLLCSGDIGIGGVQKVIVNDIVLTQNNSDVIFRWAYSTTGSRDGKPTGDYGFDSLGDPHGSIACIECVVPVQLQSSTGVPKVDVTISGPALPIPNTNPDPTTWPTAKTTNPTWHLLDLLVKSNWKYSQIDIPTFTAAAAICDASISYTNLVGATANHARFRSSFAIQSRETAAAIITALRRSFLAILVPNSTSGLLQLYIKRTLADQQPSAITGSNYNTATASVNAANVAANGYYAYSFNETNIAKNSLQVTHQPIASSTNRVNFQFQDEDNQWQADSISEVDTQAIIGAGNQEIPTDLAVIGVTNFDQATRVANVYLAEQLRGNPRNDAGGTLYVEFTTTQKAAHLRLGHIVAFTWQQLGLSMQPMRVVSLKPSRNAARWTVRLQWHMDIWYTDVYGQNAAPFNNHPRRQKKQRVPYPWSGTGIVYRNTIHIALGAVPNNSILFGMVIATPANADGSVSPTVTPQGYPPNNGTGSSVGPPLVPIQAQTGNTGGSIPPGSYIIVITSVDSAGVESAQSLTSTVDIPTGTSTNTITVTGIQWPSGAVSGNVYAGTNELTLNFAATATTASTITLTGVGSGTNRGIPPPDSQFDHFRLRTKPVLYAGSATFTASGIVAGSNSVTCAGATWTTNQWAGYYLASLNSTKTDPFSGLISANTGNSLTITGFPSGSFIKYLSDYLANGDKLVIRSSANIATATTIGDANFVNNSPGMTAGLPSVAGKVVRILFGPGEGQTRNIDSNTATTLTVAPAFTTTPTSATIFSIEETAFSAGTVAKPSATGIVSGIGTVAMPNVTGAYLIQVLTEDSQNNASPEIYAPLRDFWITGQAGANNGTSGLATAH